MTENYIRDLLFNRFESMNELLNVPFVNDNVAKPNEKFTPPIDNLWFELHFLAAKPFSAGIGKDAQNRWNGIFQIDIHAPLNMGTAESDDVYESIFQLFKRGQYIGDVFIQSIRLSDQVEENTNFKSVVRVDWSADIDN